MISERELIDKIKLAAGNNAGLLKGIGDDCAVFSSGADELTLVSMDTLVEGVHFDLLWHGAEDLGHKAAAVNISDIAAMGGRACYVLLSIAAPRSTSPAWLDDFMRGFLAELSQYKISLIGGDTVASRAGLSFSITILGKSSVGQVLYRSGAKVDDVIMVSGCLGDAAVGLELCRQARSGERRWADLTAAHLTPVGELPLGELLATSGLVTAMLDMSDGLATDLAHLCEASGLGAHVEAAMIPLSASARQAAHDLNLDLMQLALSGGEDYRLLFTCPEDHEQQLGELVQDSLGRQLFRIGKMVPGAGVHLYTKGDKCKIDYQGYEHFDA